MIDQDRQGNIIDIISTSGHQGEPGNVGYGTAKAGLLNFTRAVAIELSNYRIRVNSLTPTATDSSEAQEHAARWGVKWPVTRLGQRGCCRTPAGARPCSSCRDLATTERQRSSCRLTTPK